MTTVWCSYTPKAERLSKGERKKRNQEARAARWLAAREDAKAACDQQPEPEPSFVPTPFHGIKSGKGSSKRKILKIAMRKGHMICCYCIKPLDHELFGTNDPRRPTLEHLIPRAMGGDNSWQNLEIACYECNTLRGYLLWKVKEVKERIQRDPDFLPNWSKMIHMGHLDGWFRNEGGGWSRESDQPAPSPLESVEAA